MNLYFLKTHKKSILRSGLTVGIFSLVFFLVPNVTEAQIISASLMGSITSGITGAIGSALATIVAYLLYIPLMISGWILWLAGGFLNFVLKFTILDLKENLQGIGGIDIAWGIIRDLMNMTFIFILLYTAIQTILGIGGNRVKQTIIWVVIAAMLINFSMFFTKAIIDGSNVVALTFYNAITQCDSAGTIAGTQAGNLEISKGLANCFMRPMGLTSLFDLGAGADIAKEYGANLGKIAIVSIGGMALFVIVAFVFFAISIMFLVRYVEFIFLLILSPISVMGNALPKIQQWSKKWWDKLISQCLFAPVFMVMMWVVVAVLNAGMTGVSAGGVASTGGKFSDLFSGSNGAWGLLVNFFIIIALAIGALIISKQLADQGGTVGSKIVGGVLGAGVSGVGSIGRNTIGRAGQAVADSQWLRDRAPSSRVARLALTAGKKTGASSFDLRGNKTLGKIGGMAGVDMGKDLGLGEAKGKGGFRQKREDTVKERMQQVDDFRNVITGQDVENEMTNRRWTSQTDQQFLQGLGLNAAQIATINANGLNKNQVEAMGLNARQVEAMRRRVQGDLINASDVSTANRRERFIHDLSQTHWYSPNLYSGVGTDAEAARRMREGRRNYSSEQAEVIALLRQQIQQMEQARSGGDEGGGDEGGDTGGGDRGGTGRGPRRRNPFPNRGVRRPPGQPGPGAGPVNPPQPPPNNPPPPGNPPPGPTGNTPQNPPNNPPTPPTNNPRPESIESLRQRIIARNRDLNDLINRNASQQEIESMRNHIKNLQDRVADLEG